MFLLCSCPERNRCFLLMLSLTDVDYLALQSSLFVLVLRPVLEMWTHCLPFLPTSVFGFSVVVLGDHHGEPWLIKTIFWSHFLFAAMTLWPFLCMLTLVFFFIFLSETMLCYMNGAHFKTTSYHAMFWYLVCNESYHKSSSLSSELSWCFI